MRWNRRVPFTLLALAALAAVPVAAQEGAMPEMDPAEMAAMMEAFQKASTPGEAHAEMANTEGSWTFTIMTWMDPSAPPMKSVGTAERSMTLDGRVLEEKVVADLMGQPFNGLGRRGYDNVTGEYWATWTDTMSTGVLTSKGKRDESGAIVYHGMMTDPMNGAEVKVRSVLHAHEDGSEHFEWFEDRGEGEVKTMEIVYERADS